MKRSNQEISQELHELREWGVPVDQHFVNEVNQANRGLVLTQTGNVPENVLTATRSGRVELIGSLAICNISPCDIRVNEVQIDLPFFAPDFHLLAPDQELTSMGAYQFEKSALLYACPERELLICSGLSVEGFLRGEGAGMVPKEYRQGATVGVEVTVFASKGRRYAMWMTLLVERQDQERKQSRLPRRRLFEDDAHHELNERDEHLRLI